MKALFSRLKSASSSAREQFGGREKEPLPIPPAPPRSSASPTTHAKGLPEWPLSDRPSTATPVSAKPLPDIHLPPALDVLLPVPDSLSSASSAGVKRGAASTLDASIQQKKVAFISPPGTPSPAQPKLLLDTTTTGATSQLKSGSVAKLVAAHDSRLAGASTTSVPARAPSTTPKPTNSRTASTPTSYAPSVNQHSLRSGTPFSQTSSRTGILTTASWSEAAEEDLVSNLGPRERTRQEVLWEIVASEERYVNELLKLRETFIEPLLHPYSSSSVLNPADDGEYYREDSPAESIEHLPIASRFLSTFSQPRSESPRLTSPLARTGNGTPVIPSVDESPESEEDSPRSRKAAASKVNHPRSPYGTSTRNLFKNGKPILPFPSRSHHSLPPPARNMTTSTASLGRQSYAPDQRPGSSETDRKATSTPTKRAVLHKPKKGGEEETGIPPHLLPEDLRRCLEVIEGGIINGHLTLSAGLRKRYDDQYPLVRSLADVFVAHAQILHEYATYVLHLERALEQVDNALSTASVMKRPKKADVAEWLKISKILQRLEENAADKGETGLAISLSKPFQRLLKYPLLFQNLLFHTDPSTYEYEATLRMVAEVETIVRSIEDEKIQKEERDKTRDIFARIEGLEKVKILAVPKPSRLLVEERILDPNSPDPLRPTSPPTASSSALNPNTVKQKTSFRRISEVLGTSPSSPSPQMGSKKDLWLVVFNDVVLRCQRTGTTSLPLASSGAPGRANSLPDSKSKYASTGRRHGVVRPRNMYKFIKVENWTIGNVAKPREGIVSMEDIERIRGQTAADDNDDDDEGVESDDSDRKSKMSFSYWGADRVTIQKPIVKGRIPASTPGVRRITPTTPRASSRLGATTPTNGPSSFSRVNEAAVRESKKDNIREQKFGSRLRSPEPSMDGSVAARPASRRTTQTGGVVSGVAQRRHATTTTTMSTSTMDDSVRSTTGPVASGGVAGIGAGGGRPAWDGSKSPAPGAKRVRNVSQTSGTPPVRSGAKVSSPAPSEDSGVGLYRQMLSQDSGLAKSSK